MRVWVIVALVTGSDGSQPTTTSVARWLGLLAGGLLLLVLALAFTPRHTLEGLVGSRAALAVDLIAKAAGRTGTQTCVVIGDSRAAAFETWTSPCDVENVALYGSTTSIWRDLLPLLDATVPTNARVALWLGVNDLRYDRNASSETTAKNLIELIQKLASGERHVWVLPQIPVHFDHHERQARFEATIRHIEGRLRSHFDGHGHVTFVDLSQVVGTVERPVRTAYFDEVHLTEAACLAARGRLEEAWRAP